MRHKPSVCEVFAQYTSHLILHQHIDEKGGFGVIEEKNLIL